MLGPKLACDRKRGDLQVGPPGELVAVAVQLLMMLAAQRHREFVTDLAPECSRLRKLQVMGITGRALAHQTGLARDKRQMGLVAFADVLLNRKRHLVAGGSQLDRQTSVWTRRRRSSFAVSSG